MCYASIALVTDMDAGAESGEGVGQEEVFALFRQNLERLTGLLTDTVAGLPVAGRLRLLDLGRRHRAHLRDPGPVKVLLTGSAGFIGSRGRPALEDVGRRGGPGRPDARQGARLDRRARRAPTSSTCATRRPGPTCSTASTWSATRRPWSAPGVTVADLPAYAAPQRPRHRRPARRDARGRASTGWCWRRRWSSTARAATPAPSTATRCRRRGAAAALDAGDFENHCPVCGARARLGARRRGRPARPAQLVRRQQGRPGALRVGLGAAGRRGGGRAALPQRLRAGDAAGHAVLRRRRDVPLLARARRAAAGLRGRRADARLRARRRRGPGQPRRAAGRRRGASRGAYAAYNVCSGHPVSILDVAELVARGTGARHRARGHRRLPARRRAAHRRLAGAGAPRSSASRPRCCPRTGCRRSRPRRCGH